MIKPFTLALCGLSLWPLVSIEVSKFDPHHGYLSSVSLQLQMVYPNTWVLWSGRQMDLELMFLSIISLRMANWEKWTKFFADLLPLVLEYTISIFTATSFTFFQRSERNTFTFLSLCMDHAFIAKIFCFQLRHHMCLINVTLLQLHHRTSLTTLTFITRGPLAFITRNPLTSITWAPLTFTTRADYIHDTCSKLTLFHSSILFHSPVFIHLQIQPVSQLTYLSPTFPPLTHKSDSSPISKDI